MKKWRRFFALFLACLVCVVPTQAEAEEKEENETAQRIQRAEELGLLDWVDEEGYLIDNFFAGKSDSELSDMSLDGLIRVLSNEEVDAYVANLKAGIGLFVVSSYQKVSQVNPNTGRDLITGIFEVDGILAYCIERDKSTPPQGSPTSDWIAVTNDNIRKVLYYGYNGPEDCGYTFVETAMAVAEANGTGDNSLGRQIFAEIKEMDLPPEDFYAWKVETNNGKTQDLAFYTYEKSTGKLQLEKASVNPELTDSNESFSLKGAIYGVYKERNCETQIGQLITGADGISNELELEPGTYYLKEIQAPKGFEISKEIESVVVNKAEYTVISVVDKPIVYVELVKLVENSEQVLEGATFKHISPDGTEDIQITDAAGKIRWENLQEGLHKIEEVEAPTGYICNRNQITFTVDSNNHITVNSQVNKNYGNIKIQYDSSGNLLLAVDNKIGYKLPNTGSSREMLMYITGAFLVVWSLQKRRTMYEK